MQMWRTLCVHTVGVVVCIGIHMAEAEGCEVAIGLDRGSNMENIGCCWGDLHSPEGMRRQGYHQDT